MRVIHTIGVKITSAIAIVILCIDASCILFNYANFMTINNRYTSSLAETMANTCNLVIDGDKASEYRETRRRDTAYYETWNKLIDYRNTNDDIMDLSVAYFDDEGAHYIYDTNLKKDGAFLGDVRDFDSVQRTFKNRLIECRDTLNLEYTTHSDIYLPINSSYNIPVAYVIVGISNVNNHQEQTDYLIKLTVIITVIAFIFASILIGFMNIHIIRHINALTAAAANYDQAEMIRRENSPLQQIQIDSGDELQALLESMRKMEQDIVSSASNLAIATWNSQHDSMTQLYNKGFYQETLALWATKTSVGAIYLDVDNLKRMNDTYGHEKGDEVITRTANFAKKYETDGAVSCRIGGDEFVVLIPDITQEGLEALVEKMRHDPASYLAEWCEEFVCRIAVGGAAQHVGEGITDVIKRAEVEMYGNKHATR